MSPITATTTKALHVDAGPAVTFAIAERPEYRYIGGGRFEPANAAAHEECRRWNAWADEVNARAHGGIAQ
jgi:hypothetical protein